MIDTLENYDSILPKRVVHNSNHNKCTCMSHQIVKGSTKKFLCLFNLIFFKKVL